MAENKPDPVPELKSPAKPPGGAPPSKPAKLVGDGGYGRKFQTMYVKHYVYVPIEESGRQIMHLSHYWTGLRLETTFLTQGSLNQSLGLYTQAQLDSIEPSSTHEKETSQTAAARNGLVYELSFTVVPAASETPVSPFGERYTTTLLVSADVSFNDAAKAIRNQKFRLGKPESTYEVERGSVVQKKSKDTTWRYQL